MYIYVYIRACVTHAYTQTRTHTLLQIYSMLHTLVGLLNTSVCVKFHLSREFSASYCTYINIGVSHPAFVT